jgi:hypothetical protein
MIANYIYVSELVSRRFRYLCSKHCALYVVQPKSSRNLNAAA